MVVNFQVTLQCESSRLAGSQMSERTVASVALLIAMVAAQQSPAQPTKEDLAKDNKLFITGKRKVDIVGVAALVAAHRSATKARASRTNGRLGGRPRSAGAVRQRRKASR
jgi:hypothetical protein